MHSPIWVVYTFKVDVSARLVLCVKNNSQFSNMKLQLQMLEKSEESTQEILV